MSNQSSNSYSILYFIIDMSIQYILVDIMWIQYLESNIYFYIYFYIYIYYYVKYVYMYIIILYIYIYI